MRTNSWAKNFFTKSSLSWIGLIVGVFAFILASYWTGQVTAFTQNILMKIGINIILAVGLNLIVGYAGQFSLGHAGFMAIGAYSAALVSKAIPGVQGMFLGMGLGLVITFVLALVVGIPTLRLRGDYLAIATLGIAEIIRITIMNLEITNGAAGITGIPQNVNWITLYVFVVITTLIIVNFIHSSPGRAMIAVREDEIAAESVGLQTTRYKTIAFVLGALTASIAGTLYASYFGVITPGQFTFQKSIDILIIVVFGGIGSITGSFAAAILLELLNVILAPYGQLRMIVYSLAIIAIMIFKSSGLMGEFELRFSPFFKQKKQYSKLKKED
ncbi:branched-chain amino acid ABC transporter permease [Aerococcus sanguinicola]